ncbi:VOC family protein, partial [Streptomyces scabiei]
NSTRLDHVVLWVRDPVAAADFYEKTVGMEPLRITEYTAGTVSFPSVRLNEETIFDLAPLSLAERMNMLPGAADSAGHPVNHVCLSLSGD